jgi:ABC-2 type transport system permease protein
MKQYSHGNLNFEFIDPSNNKALIKELQEKGFPPIPVTVRTSASETKQKALFPVAKMIYQQNPQYIDLLKGCTLPTGQVDFLRAEADLEYKLVSPMRNLIRENKQILAILQGHGEASEGITGVGEWIEGLRNGYKIGKYDMRDPKNYGQAISPDIKVMLIPQPKTAFTEREKYELDQYVMRGGSLFFVMNQQVVDMDMFEKRSTMTMLRELNLDDMFLKYGFKINYDLIQDLNCESTEVFQEGASGGTFKSEKWLFYPLIKSMPQTPLNRNADLALLRYASSIDTMPLKDTKKTVFLTSSELSRTISGQQFLDLSEIMKETPPAPLFRNKGNRIAGLVVEGMFPSLFAGRQAPIDSLAPKLPTAKFGERSGLPGKIAIISDGEFCMGKWFRGKRGYMPYDNKTLLLNVVDYLSGDVALTEIRSKDIEPRTLDRNKVINHETGIRIINLLLPLLALFIFGFTRFYLRKRKNEGYKQV